MFYGSDALIAERHVLREDIASLENSGDQPERLRVLYRRLEAVNLELVAGAAAEVSRLAARHIDPSDPRFDDLCLRGMQASARAASSYAGTPEGFASWVSKRVDRDLAKSVRRGDITGPVA